MAAMTIMSISKIDFILSAIPKTFCKKIQKLLVTVRLASLKKKNAIIIGAAIDVVKKRMIFLLDMGMNHDVAIACMGACGCFFDSLNRINIGSARTANIMTEGISGASLDIPTNDKVANSPTTCQREFEN